MSRLPQSKGNAGTQCMASAGLLGQVGMVVDRAARRSAQGTTGCVQQGFWCCCLQWPTCHQRFGHHRALTSGAAWS
jgi:hypothetical protein